MVVNPPANGGPNGDRTLENYAAAAAEARTGPPPPRAFGGEVRAASGDGSASTPTDGSTPTPTDGAAAESSSAAAAGLGQNFGLMAAAGAFAWLL